MNKEDFIKLIDGEMWYKSDYAYWLYKQLEDRDNKISKAIEYIEQEDWNTEYDKKLLDILRGNNE